jgi:hypothetical protein
MARIMAAINERFYVLFWSEQAEITIDRPLAFFFKVHSDVILELSVSHKMVQPVGSQCATVTAVRILGIWLFE